MGKCNDLRNKYVCIHITGEKKTVLDETSFPNYVSP